MLDSNAFVDQALTGYQASQQPAGGKTTDKTAKKMSLEQINAVAQDFEAFFVSMMSRLEPLPSMTQTLKTLTFKNSAK